jgi:hypothetical protein
MARRRYQKPSPRKEGLQWVLYYWDDFFIDGERRRKKRRQVLGPASMGEREAEKIRDEVLRPLNQGLVKIGSATRFEDYVESVYQPVVLPTMAKSTRDRAMSVYKNYLKPAFGGMCLRDVSPLTVQRFVSGMVEWNLAQESKDKIRDVLSSVLSSAVQYKLVLTNPVEGVRLPVARRGTRQKPFITQEQFALLLEGVNRGRTNAETSKTDSRLDHCLGRSRSSERADADYIARFRPQYRWRVESAIWSRSRLARGTLRRDAVRWQGQPGSCLRACATAVARGRVDRGCPP